MCRSAAEGGQRCYSHAAQKLARAEHRLAAARNASHQAETTPTTSPSAAEHQEAAAHLAVCDALAELASTRRGATEIAARRHDGTLAPALADAMLAEGQFLRDRAQLIRTYNASGHDPNSVCATTGEYYQDQAIAYSLRALIADPSAHRTRPYDVRAVRIGHSVTEQDAEVDRWQDRVRHTSRRQTDTTLRIMRLEMLRDSWTTTPPKGMPPRHVQHELARLRQELASEQDSMAYLQTTLVCQARNLKKARETRDAPPGTV